MSPSSGCLGWLVVWNEQPKHSAGGAAVKLWAVKLSAGHSQGPDPQGLGGQVGYWAAKGPGAGSAEDRGALRKDTRTLLLSCLSPEGELSGPASPAQGYRHVLLFYQDKAPSTFGSWSAIKQLLLPMGLMHTRPHSRKQMAGAKCSAASASGVL